MTPQPIVVVAWRYFSTGRWSYSGKMGLSTTINLTPSERALPYGVVPSPDATFPGLDNPIVEEIEPPLHPYPCRPVSLSPSPSPSPSPAADCSSSRSTQTKLF